MDRMAGTWTTSEASEDRDGISGTACQLQGGHMGYLDGLLAALDLLNLGLGQGDPLPNGLQLPPAELYSLGDPAREKESRPEGCFPSTPASACKPAKPRAWARALRIQCSLM